jgi:hypothetical protein
MSLRFLGNCSRCKQNKLTLRKPFLVSILNDRLVCAMIIGASLLQLSLVGAGLPGWQSPIHSVLGIPDPGCGLSRAVVALLRGDWRTSLAFHAFAPFFIATLSLMSVTVILPQAPRDRLINLVEGLERQTGLTTIFLVSLIIYWLARLLFMPEAFIKLIAG